MTGSQNLRKRSLSGPGKCPRCLFLKEAFTLKIIHVHSWLWHDPKSECFLKFCSLQKKIVQPWCFPSPTQVLVLGCKRVKGVDTRSYKEGLK